MTMNPEAVSEKHKAEAKALRARQKRERKTLRALAEMPEDERRAFVLALAAEYAEPKP